LERVNRFGTSMVSESLHAFDELSRPRDYTSSSDAIRGTVWSVLVEED
jgi:hypothetical protein